MDTPAHFWKVWIDTGGTFTDCLAYAPYGLQGGKPGRTGSQKMLKKGQKKSIKRHRSGQYSAGRYFDYRNTWQQRIRKERAIKDAFLPKNGRNQCKSDVIIETEKGFVE